MFTGSNPVHPTRCCRSINGIVHNAFTVVDASSSLVGNTKLGYSVDGNTQDFDSCIGGSCPPIPTVLDSEVVEEQDCDLCLSGFESHLTP